MSIKNELIIYKTNLDSFFNEINDSIVETIAYDIDENPTFDKESLPFKFKYCNNISFITSKGNFQMTTSMTTEGLNAFWIMPLQKEIISTSFAQINSKIKSFSFKNGYNNYVFKISIEFENMKLFIYSAEIYDTSTEVLDYKKNDEMILVFDNQNEAEMFENLVN